MNELLGTLNRELAGVASGARTALVQVRNGRRSAGAGVIWSPDGTIITNAHVVQGRHPKVVLSDGRTFTGRVIKHDRRRDLAALKIDAGTLPSIATGDSEKLRTGDWVMALGHPWGVIGAATAGAVIAVGPPLEFPTRGDMVQVSLQLRPGHSGGALVDGNGALVGVNTMITGPNVGLAVPEHVVRRFLPQQRYHFV